jgi:hypothetical protein
MKSVVIQIVIGFVGGGALLYSVFGTGALIQWPGLFVGIVVLLAAPTFAFNYVNSRARRISFGLSLLTAAVITILLLRHIGAGGDLWFAGACAAGGFLLTAYWVLTGQCQPQ